MPGKFCLSAFYLSSYLLLTGCNLRGRQSFVDAKGEVAQIQLDLFLLTVYVTGGIFVVVGGVLLWAVWRYRERKSDVGKALPPQGHGNPLVELGLVLVSILLLVIIAIPTVRAIWYTHSFPEDPDSHLGSWYAGPVADGAEEEPLIVYAYGWQWWFSFEYPQLGVVTGNEFAIPEGKRVRIELRSKDVIHSFWIPKLAGKVDMIPGRNNWMWIKGDVPGHYWGQCAEYCGESHAYMQFRANVLPVEEFAAWVEHQKSEAPAPHGADWGEFVRMNATDRNSLPDDPVVRGASLFFGKAACVQCHQIQGSVAAGKLGPDLTHVGSRASLAAGWMEHSDESGVIDAEQQYDNLFRWIRESEKIKPGNLMYHAVGGLRDIELSDEEVHDLAAFMQFLQ